MVAPANCLSRSSVRICSESGLPLVLVIFAQVNPHQHAFARSTPAFGPRISRRPATGSRLDKGTACPQEILAVSAPASGRCGACGLRSWQAIQRWSSLRPLFTRANDSCQADNCMGGFLWAGFSVPALAERHDLVRARLLRIACALVVLAGVVLKPIAGSAQTSEPPAPLFTRNDIYLGAAFVLGDGRARPVRSTRRPPIAGAGRSGAPENTARSDRSSDTRRSGVSDYWCLLLRDWKTHAS